MNYKYCPSCGAEYRPKFNICADCQVALSSQPPAAPKIDDEPTEIIEFSARSLAPVFVSGRRSDAEMARGFLEAQGVEAEVWSTGLSPWHAAAGVGEMTGVPSDFGAHRVMVPEDQTEEAKTLLVSVDAVKPVTDEVSFDSVGSFADAAEPFHDDAGSLDSALDFLRRRWAVLAFALTFLLILVVFGTPT